jgi:uncharacterized coiled-coil protein SlyX
MQGGMYLEESVMSQVSNPKRTLEEEVRDLKFTITSFKNRIDQITVLAIERNKMLKKQDEQMVLLTKKIDEINKKVK